MQIIKNFGIDPGLLIAQIVNFLIILYILKRFLYKPLMKVMKKREDTIKQGLLDAKAAQEKLEDALTEQKTMLENAKKQANSIIEDAALEAKQKAREIEEQSKARSEAMLAAAKKEIEMQMVETEKKLSKHVIDLASKMLEKSLEELLDQKEHQEIAKTAIRKFKKAN